MLANNSGFAHCVHWNLCLQCRDRRLTTVLKTFSDAPPTYLLGQACTKLEGSNYQHKLAARRKCLFHFDVVISL